MAMIEPTEDAAIDPQEFIAFVTQSDNLAAEMDRAQLEKIGQEVCELFEIDYESMSEWRARMDKAINLAKLVKEDKDYPFKGAANIKYPLVTSAALQFNARAYPAIVPSSNVVKCRVWGPDPEGAKAARGERISSFMSWQLTAEMDEWERETDKLLLQLPIVGDCFRKVWWDGERKRCRLIEPGKFVVNCQAQTLDDAPRCSEILDLFPHEIEDRIRSGRFVAFDYDDDPQDRDTPQEFIEVHCRLDMDEDDYPEPYVVTIHKERQEVVRLVADFETDDVAYLTEQRQVMAQMQTPEGFVVAQPQVQEIVTGIRRIKRNSYFVHYQFMPGIGDGMLGTGLGILLGDISSAVNTMLNMIIDAGHYASLGGGFIGQEFNIRGGNQRMRPGEWRKASVTGGDIRASIVPMTYPGPDATMFQALGMLMDAGKEISSTKDIITNESAAQMTATTAMALIEQGMKVFTAAYKRIFLSLKKEFRLIAELNARYLDPQQYTAFLDAQEPVDPRQDFSLAGMDIEPVADPNAITKTQEMARAQLVMELAQGGLVDPAAAVQRILEAAGIDDVQELVPQPNPLQEQMGQMEMEIRRADLVQKQVDIEKTLAEIESERAKAVETLAGIELDQRRQRLDGLKAILEESRTNVEHAIQLASSGMAGVPGRGGPVQRNAQAAGAPQGVDVASILGRQPGAGGGTPGGGVV